MKIAKKILSLLICSLLIFSINFSNGASNMRGDYNIPYERPVEVNKPTVNDDEAINIGDGSKTVSDKVLGIIQVPQPDNYDTSLSYVLAIIQISVNWILGLLSFVALVYMLYCGFLIFFSGSENKNAQKGKKGIATAATALAGIGLSWLIISAMIWLITNVATTD